MSSSIPNEDGLVSYRLREVEKKVDSIDEKLTVLLSDYDRRQGRNLGNKALYTYGLGGIALVLGIAAQIMAYI